MTYCVGVKLDEGLIMASDSRTHAGVDNYATFCKMTVFERPGDRVERRQIVGVVGRSEFKACRPCPGQSGQQAHRRSVGRSLLLQTLRQRGNDHARLRQFLHGLRRRQD